VKIVARTQNELSSQDVPTQMLTAEISLSTEWKSERRSCNPPLVCID